MVQDDLKLLLSITDGCRDDMHEPDNEGVTAVVIGTHLDNAMGINRKRPISADDLFMEYVVIIRRRERGKPDRIERFNLCNLIALARRAPGRS